MDREKIAPIYKEAYKVGPKEFKLFSRMLRYAPNDKKGMCATWEREIFAKWKENGYSMISPPFLANSCAIC